MKTLFLIAFLLISVPVANAKLDYEQKKDANGEVTITLRMDNVTSSEYEVARRLFDNQVAPAPAVPKPAEKATTTKKPAEKPAPTPTPRPDKIQLIHPDGTVEEFTEIDRVRVRTSDKTIVAKAAKKPTCKPTPKPKTDCKPIVHTVIRKSPVDCNPTHPVIIRPKPEVRYVYIKEKEERACAPPPVYFRTPCPTVDDCTTKNLHLPYIFDECTGEVLNGWEPVDHGYTFGPGYEIPGTYGVTGSTMGVYGDPW